MPIYHIATRCYLLLQSRHGFKMSCSTFNVEINNPRHVSTSENVYDVDGGFQISPFLRLYHTVSVVFTFQYLLWSKIFGNVCCKGYSITLQEFKRNEGRVLGT